MATQALIIVVLLAETGLFLLEVILSAISGKNKQLRKARSLNEVDFINLKTVEKLGRK